MGIAGLIGLVLWLAVLIVFYFLPRRGYFSGKGGWDKLRGEKKDKPAEKGGTGKSGEE